MTLSDVTQIKIGKHKFGFVGLKEAFKDLAERYADKPDGIVAEELLNRLLKNNYIPDKVQLEYGRAFVREFRKFLGQPYDDEHAGGLEIKVLGAGCILCNTLENEVMEVLAEMNLTADLEHVRNVEQISKYKVKGTPALIINGKVVSTGGTPSKTNIRKWLAEISGHKNSGETMEKQEFIKNIAFSEPHNLSELVGYEEGRVVSRTFAQNSSLSLTLFSFDEGEGLSTHTAPGDAMVQILDGEAVINVGGKEMTAGKGQVVVMPADIPHSVTAAKRFKMLLTLVKKPKV